MYPGLTLCIRVRNETHGCRLKFSMSYYKQKITHFAIDMAFYKSCTVKRSSWCINYIPINSQNQSLHVFFVSYSKKHSVRESIATLFWFLTLRILPVIRSKIQHSPESTRPLIFQLISCLASITYNTTDIYNLKVITNIFLIKQSQLDTFADYQFN